MIRNLLRLGALLVIGLAASAPNEAEAASLCAWEGQVCNPQAVPACCNPMTLCTAKEDPILGAYHICEAVD